MRISAFSKALVGALAAACIGATFAAPVGAAAKACASDYTYAGMTANARSHGISAVITPLAEPQVQQGHIAGWVGVGGVGFGPGGSSEWIQIGLSDIPGSPTSLYYEVRQPDWAAKYVLLKETVAPGERHRVAVLEAHGHPNAWRVWLDGHAVSPMYYLPGSHTGWKPQATAESWNAQAHVCNDYAYSFSGISLSSRPGGNWRPLAKPSFDFEDAGYSMTRRSHSSFVAASRTLLRTLDFSK